MAIRNPFDRWFAKLPPFWRRELGFLALFLAFSQVIGKLLFGIAATDPLSLSVAPLVIALAAIAACVVPVRRATTVSPLEALR